MLGQLSQKQVKVLRWGRGGGGMNRKEAHKTTGKAQINPGNAGGRAREGVHIGTQRSMQPNLCTKLTRNRSGM
eukprot:12703946-Prorocentrum_lima.AAC.1